jgi:hypothetical protein
MGVLGYPFVYVGFVLFINALMLCGTLNPNQVITMNAFTGILIFFIVMRTVFFTTFKQDNPLKKGGHK